MKKKLTTVFCVLGLLTGCIQDKDYDIYNGVNPEMRLFEDQVSLPVGSTAIISLEDIQEKVKEFGEKYGLGRELFSPDEEGDLVFTQEENLIEANPYLIIFDMEDPYAPSSWSTYGGAVPLTPAVAAMFNFSVIDQNYELQIFNPLKDEVIVDGTASLVVYDKNYSPAFSEKYPFVDMSIPRGETKTVWTYSVSNDIPTGLTNYGVDDITFTFPYGLINSIPSSDDDIVVKMIHRSKLSVPSDFRMQLDFDIDAKVPVGQYGLKKMQLKLDLENSLPLSVPEAKLTIDDNILISGNLHIDGGTVANPAVSSLILDIEAAEGTIPDLKNMKLSLVCSGTEGLAKVPMNIHQGIRVKKAAAILKGGIALSGNEN